MNIAKIALAALLSAALSFPAAAAPSEASRRRLMTEEAIASARLRVPQDSLDRRLRSQRRLQSEGVPINQYLPAIEGESEARRRTAEELVDRTLALLLVAGRSEGMERAATETLVRELGIERALSPAERAFIASDKPDEHASMQFSWRYEAAVPLLWALGFVDTLDKPVAPRDAEGIVRMVAGRSRAELLAAARLRPLPRILDEADLIYRYHWAVREAERLEQEIPAGLNRDVVMERHHALNWLIGYMDQDWDDVSTHT